MKQWVNTVFIVTVIIGSCLFHVAAGSVPRPPQFVVLAFDDCKELETWRTLSAFSKEMRKKGSAVHFTFFVSGTLFLTDANKNRYQGPGHQPGEAEVPFGGSKQEVVDRIRVMNQFYQNGNEFGSHAVGHFDGGNWTTEDWKNEFRQYNDLFLHVARNNGLTSNVSLAFPLSEIIGFRAPYLSVGPALYPALKAYHFRYDTNSISNADAWPTQKDGLWYFDLVRLTIAGTGKHTISMDYNFWLAQSNAKPDPKNQDRFRDQMYRTYIHYFLTNYTGNRAPLRIGHHFTPFQGGVYNQALLAFASRICGLPEVQCVTFASLAHYLDQLNPQTLAAYQKGDFPHLSNKINPY